MKKNAINPMLLILFCFNLTYAQNLKQAIVPLEMGKPMPHFNLTDVRYHADKQLNLENFKGKWLILDFWSVNCSSCIKAMPKYDHFQKEYTDDIQVMLVGITPPDKNGDMSRSLILLSKLYNRLRKEYDLGLSIAYDGILYGKFGIAGVPCIMIIDPNGILQGITNSLSEEDLKIFISTGKAPVKFEKYRLVKADGGRVSAFSNYKKSEPILLKGNGEGFSKVLYRSMISEIETGGYWENSGSGVQDGYADIFPLTLYQLYSTAYTGYGGLMVTNLYPKMILETKDSLQFSDGIRSSLKKYAYSIISTDLKQGTSLENLKKVQLIMQMDIKNYFGYNAAIEVRKVPYLRLVAKEKAILKVKSRGGAPQAGSEPGIVAYKNYPIHSAIIESLKTASGQGLIIRNETGYDGNVDIRLNANYMNFDGLRTELRKQGFDLVPGEVEMKCLVIRDPKPENETAN